MGEHKKFQGQIDEVAKLISDYNLSEASLEVDDFKIVLRRQRPQVVAAGPVQQMVVQDVAESPAPGAVAAPSAPVQQGTPISSPMMGIFYSSSGPSSPPYVNEGDSVTAGQVVGLIEAMKVFNEIHASVSGTVKKIAAENGTLVNPGDPLMYIG